MNKIGTLILLLSVLSTGCAHNVTVRLHVPQDYSPPAAVPFTSPQDKENYLEAHKQGWLYIATNCSKTVVLSHLEDRIVIHHVVEPGLHSLAVPKAMRDGRMDGSKLAEEQLRNLVDRVFEEAGQPDVRKKANNHKEVTGE